MRQELEQFVRQTPDFYECKQVEQIAYFVYFLTQISNSSNRTKTSEIKECYQLLDLSTPNVSARLSEGAKNTRNQPRIFLQDNEGWYLERRKKTELDKILQDSPIVQQTNKMLRDLLDDIAVGARKEFLEEAITCYEFGAFRACIVMGWIVTIDHLFEYVFNRHLPAFNTSLAKRSHKKPTQILVKDDFSELKEYDFIEICRSANIISKDVRKILDEKLGIRNSAGHPSGIKIKKIKATDFLQDLITNVIVKYSI